MKVLLVDDDNFLRDMYATMFQQSGDDVTVAETPEEALRICKDHTFDVVLTDMIMPGISGLELIEKLRSTNEDFKSLIIVLSNQSEDHDKQAAKEKGADGYIVKAECIPSEVVAKVHEIVNKK